MKQPDNRPQDARFRHNRTFICSVVYLDIVEYSKKPVNEQIVIKEKFNELLTEAIRDISVNDRIILDTGDGAAISFLGDPEDALFVAMSFRDELAVHHDEIGLDLRVRIGINLGPVKLLRDINNQPNLIGDGINVAQRIMSFAEPGQLLVSRSYFDIVSCLSQEYARLFEYQGARADKHIREHDVYSVGHAEAGAGALHGPHKKTGGIAVVDETAAPVEKPAAAGPAVAPPPSAAPKKNPLIIGGAIAAAVIALAAIFFVSKGKAPAPADGQKAVIEEKAGKSEKSSKRAAAESRTEGADRADSRTEAAVEKKADVEKARAKAAKKAEAKAEPEKESFRSATVSADGIYFTLTSVKSSHNQITYTVRAVNKSNAAKSVALYDDAFSWPKSRVVDSGGTSYYVNTVNFIKSSKTVTAKAAGRDGIPMADNESVTAHLTFKNLGSKRIKEFKLHPFIYQGSRNWKEHDLAMK
jgi:hypothetical protein